jgi:hypothetical protein
MYTLTANQTHSELTYNYLTVNQFIKTHKAFTNGGLRALIFNEHKNGLAKAGAIVRIGAKVLINEAKFFGWVESQNGGAL